jgi:hypothetical protein
VPANRVLRISGHVKGESKEAGGNYIYGDLQKLLLE